MKKADALKGYGQNVKREVSGCFIGWSKVFAMFLWLVSLPLAFGAIDRPELRGTLSGFRVLLQGFLEPRPVALMLSLAYLSVPLSGLVGWKSSRWGTAIAATGLIIPATVLSLGRNSLLFTPAQEGSQAQLRIGLICFVAAVVVQLLAQLVGVWRRGISQS